MMGCTQQPEAGGRVVLRTAPHLPASAAACAKAASVQYCTTYLGSAVALLLFFLDCLAFLTL